jgi:hypothetical protein
MAIQRMFTRQVMTRRQRLTWTCFSDKNATREYSTPSTAHLPRNSPSKELGKTSSFGCLLLDLFLPVIATGGQKRFKGRS